MSWLTYLLTYLSLLEFNTALSLHIRTPSFLSFFRVKLENDGWSRWTYCERLERLGLWNLEERRNRADIIEVFKMAKGWSTIPLEFMYELSTTMQWPVVSGWPLARTLDYISNRKRKSTLKCNGHNAFSRARTDRRIRISFYERIPHSKSQRHFHCSLYLVVLWSGLVNLALLLGKDVSQFLQKKNPNHNELRITS